MDKMRVVGISAFCAGMVLLMLIMAHFLTVLTGYAFPDSGEVTSNHITLDSSWVDVMQYAVIAFFGVSLVCAIKMKSFGLIATLGLVSFFTSALFEDLLTSSLGTALLVFSGLCVVVAVWLVFTDGWRFTGFIPKAPDDASGASQPTTRMDAVRD